MSLCNSSFVTLMCLHCIFRLQDPLASSSASGLFQHSDDSQHFLKLCRRSRRVTEPIEMVDQHLGIHSPTLGDDIIADHYHEIFAPRVIASSYRNTRTWCGRRRICQTIYPSGRSICQVCEQTCRRRTTYSS